MTKSIANFYRGDTKLYKFDFGAVDITGWKIFFTLKLTGEETDTDAAMQVIATAGDNTNDDILNGVMYVNASSIDTGNLIPNQTYYYGFQRLIPGSPPDVKTLMTGKVKVLQDISVSVT